MNGVTVGCVCRHACTHLAFKELINTDDEGSPSRKHRAEYVLLHCFCIGAESMQQRMKVSAWVWEGGNGFEVLPFIASGHT